MASHPSSNDEIIVEPQSHPHNDDLNVEPQSQPRIQVGQLVPQQAQQPQQTEIYVTQPRTTSSHSQSSNRSNRISPAGTAESQVPLTRPAVSFYNPRDTSAATLGSPERLELDVPFPAYDPADGRVSRHPTMRVPNGEHANSSRRASDFRRSTLIASEDWTYPSVEDRLEKTLSRSKEERNKSQLAARTARWSMLFVAGAQVLLGALTTGLSALRLDGQKSASATTALGILSTLSGSYLAHIQATREPETSLMRIHKLDAFIRKLDDFILDYGHDRTNKYKSDIDQFRHDFEVILAQASSSTSMIPNILPVKDKTKPVPKDASV